MVFTLETTIKDLFEQKFISVRTYNSLHYARMETLGTILDNIETPTDLLSLRNLGRKSLAELIPILEKTSREQTVGVPVTEEEKLASLGKELYKIITDAYTAVTKGDSEMIAYIKKTYPNPLALHDLVMGELDDMLKIIKNYSLDENRIIRQTFKRFVELVLIRMWYAHQTENRFYFEYKRRNKDLAMTIDDFSQEQITRDFLSPKAKEYLEKIYKEQLEGKLSVRTYNFAAKHVPHFSDLIIYADKPLAAYRNLCPGQNMTKTLFELREFNQEFKKVFDKVSMLSDDELQMEYLKLNYPYLVSRQRVFVSDFIEGHKHAPMFFLLLQYLRLSENKTDKIYCLRHGIFDGEQRTLNEVADVMNLSRERIRQIANGIIDVQESTLAKSGDWKYYKNLFSLPLIYEKTDEFVRLNEVERLSVDFNVFASLVKLMANFKEMNVGEHTFLMDNSRNGIAFSECLNRVIGIINAKYSSDTYVPIDTIVAPLPGVLKTEMRRVIFFISTEIYKVRITEDGQLYLPQNFVDIGEELYDILAQNGEPMHVKDIFNAFKARHPESKYAEPLQIKTFLYKHNHIKPIGKSSYYGLDKWDGIFFGSIRDLLIDSLSASDVPLHIDKLFEDVSKHYPKTTKSSLSSTMQSDSSQRFVEFVGSYFGLTSKEYPEDYVVETGLRYSFEERLEMFQDFVETYHRFPGSDGSELENSLMRWYYRASTGSLTMTEEQRAKLDDLSKRFDDLGYPRTATENEFLIKCQDMKDFIRQNHTLPSNNKAPEMYAWFRRSCDNYDSYTDKRRRYMTELLNYVLSLGFSI